MVLIRAELLRQVMCQTCLESKEACYEVSLIAGVK